MCIGKCGCLLLGLLIVVAVSQPVSAQNVSISVTQDSAGFALGVGCGFAKIVSGPPGDPGIQMPIGDDAVINVAIWDHGADNCPGGSPSPPCLAGPSTRWGVRTTGPMSGIPTNSDMLINVTTPGKICERTMDAAYTIVPSGVDPCNRLGFTAEGKAWGAHYHFVEFMADTVTVPTGACCITGDCYEGGCIDDLAEEQCNLLGGTYMGDGTICANVECIDTIPTLTEWGMIIFCVLLFGFMAWVVVRQKGRSSIQM